MKKKVLVIILIAFVVCAHKQSRAASNREDRAVAIFKNGVSHFKQNRFQKAVDAFRQANELKPSWKLHYNIGQCEAALKRYGLAIEAFERYLGEGGDEVTQDRRKEVLNELEQMRKMVGNIKINGPRGVDIYIDKIKRGHTPINSAILVTAGVNHWIWLVKDGSKLLSIKETLSGGETLELEVPHSTPAEEPAPVVIEEPTDSVAEEEPEPSEPAIESVEALQPVEEKEETDGPQKGLSPIYFWTGAGATVVFGGLTMIMALVADSKWEDAEDADNPWDGDDKLSDITSEIRALQIVGYVSLGLTGAALIATGIFIPFTNWGDKDNAQKDVSWAFKPWAAPDAGGLFVSGRF